MVEAGAIVGDMHDEGVVFGCKRELRPLGAGMFCHVYQQLPHRLIQGIA